MRTGNTTLELNYGDFNCRTPVQDNGSRAMEGSELNTDNDENCT